MWMVYEDNETWAVPKRPKFVIRDTAEKIDELIKHMEYSRDCMGQQSARDTHFSAEPIREFESVEVYKQLEDAYIQGMIEAERARFFRQMYTRKLVT